MVEFIDAHRATYGVEPMCRVLPIAPATYYWHKAQTTDPRRRSRRAQRDAQLRPDIQRVYDANQHVYGAKKVWKQLNREAIPVARCTVARLMRELGLRGAMRGQAWTCTTVAAPGAERPHDLVARQFTAARPNQLGVADVTYVATWRGFVYVAFVIDVFSRRIVGWRASASMRTNLALDALEQAVYDRETDAGLIHHSDGGAQGGCNRSSQHLTRRGCDVRSEKVGTLDARRAALTGTTARRTARRSAAVLGGDCARVLRRSGGGRGARVVGRRGTVVSTGRGYAANAPCSVRAPAVRALPVLCRA
jgi:hypothetical protein